MESSSPEDTLKAYKRAMEVRKRLNKEDFAKVAKEVSDDKSSAVEGGNIGYTTVFQTVLPFEDAIYSLPVGTISQPVRTMYGYHIIKVNSKRPFRGNLYVAHIMKIVPQNADAET
jgi:peptidyl-prolyl cis-trans isomerase SurA